MFKSFHYIFNFTKVFLAPLNRLHNIVFDLVLSYHTNFQNTSDTFLSS